MVTIKPELISECRSCLESNGQLHNLFNVYKKVYFLPQIIFDCTGVEVIYESNYSIIPS